MDITSKLIIIVLLIVTLWIVLHKCNQKELFVIDSDNAYIQDRKNRARLDWNIISPVATDIAWNAKPPLSNIYMTGIDPKELETAVQTSFKNEMKMFPNNHVLNTKYTWMSFKPRTIPRVLIDKIITEFMIVSKLYDMHGFYVINHRITAANVSKTDDYLLTLDIIVHKESLMYGKVFEITVLFDSSNNNLLFENVKLKGVVHEQYLGTIHAFIDA